MKLHGVIELTVPGEPVLRTPNLWDKARRAFGGEPDLRTDQMRASMESTAIVEASRTALNTLGATNAISLVIDDHVLYQDREGRPDDFGDLLGIGISFAPQRTGRLAGCPLGRRFVDPLGDYYSQTS